MNTDMQSQGENKTLQDSEKQNHENWDGKYEDILYTLQDWQHDKDQPKSQVVDINVEDLLVIGLRFAKYS